MKFKCIQCDSKACVFHTDAEENVNYLMCRSCGKIWRNINGSIPDIDETSDEAGMLDILSLDSFEAYTEAVMRQEMKDCVFKCDLCGTIAFEIALGFYQCSNEDCSFEWEEY